MRQLPWCASKLCQVIERVKSGVYTSSKRAQIHAYAFLGGGVFFWLKWTLKERCYAAARELFFNGWPLIVVAAIQRLRVLITGRRPIEVLPGLRTGDDKRVLTTAP